MPHVAMMPPPALSIQVQVHPSLKTVYVRMKDRSGTVAIDMTPALASPKALIVRFHELAFGKSFPAFAANSSLLTRRREQETPVSSLAELRDGEVLVYKPCEELRTLVEQGCITPVLATHSPLAVSPSSSPLGLKRKGRAKSVTNNVERVHRYASDLAKMDVSPRERELIEDMLIVGDEQVVDAMEQFVVHRNPALVRRVLRGPVDTLSMDFSSMDVHSPAVPTSEFSDPFLMGPNPFVRAAAETEAQRPSMTETQRPSMMNLDDGFSAVPTDGGRPSLMFDGDALTSPPIFLQSIKEKVTPPAGQGRMSLSLSNDLDPSVNAQAPTQLFSIEKLLDNVPVARDFHEKYSVGSVLGSGKYSVVKRCTKKETGEQFAVKIIDKRQMIEVRFLKRELEIMYGMRHDGVVRLMELFETNESLFLVMELCGQELFEFIDRNGPLPESTTRPLIRKLVRTVAYLHAQCIVHRDIKPENILLPPNSQDVSDIKLSDFGIARKLDGHGHDNVLTPHESLSEVANLHDGPSTNASGLPSATDMVRNRMARAHTKCGTRDYIAPEVMSGKGYGTEADLWSVGVVTYVLASGCAPVFLPTAEGVKKVFFSDESWSGVSEDLKRFIEALLVRNPEKRITAADALEHPWLKE
ncbi:hypothetical protein PF005_g6583 [Phytophthora fragariae]|uniref:Protein kinase domain-containing protein n=1 Tax=Phytophthora fragariae TaxID=53985 RepID=A0A6A3YTW6_9STRA|nr:hypothetical protein PF009_g14325 [Phytophthora fragariae]KAE9002521.1 hypothetical protein PF011_g13284 [Phytophthora fragariae]KAE9103044.1 hypothetical protein PF010_g13887 [Phytophthora fragariae]KAE9103280.1 hypothetical protein PF007_g14466 [Phytophthora fragariae]KAE9140953.1 hypothetical protein PF006_g13413 [Phytophthora fragariae]